ncbi:MAG: phosphoglycerate dehydrogenase [Methylocystaceae bacterium]
MTYRILVSERVAEAGIDILRQGAEVDYRDGISREELLDIIGEYDALVVRSVTKVDEELIKKGLPRLKMVGRAGNGVDNIQIDVCTRHGVIVANTPDSNTISAAELTIGHILASCRKLPQATAFLKAGKWDRKPFRGMELFEKTVGIIGLGRIGSMVCLRLASFGMKVIAYDPYIADERFDRFGAEKRNSLAELLAEADIVTVHTPRNEETMSLLGEKELALCRDGVRVINCARGGIINEKALYAAIVSGKVASAGLDVYEEEPAVNNPLFELPQVTLTPHLGADTLEAQERVGTNIAENVLKALHGEIVPNIVNLPTMLPGELDFLRPYLELVRRMGAVYYQLSKQPIDRVELMFGGEVSRSDTNMLTIAFLAGLLAPVMSEKVNFVNARLMAEERGIKVYERKILERKREPGSTGYSSVISTHIYNRDGITSMMGTLSGAKEPLIVQINGYDTGLIPEGYVVMAENVDKPGVIGHFTTTLGNAGVNIGMMRAARKQGVNLMMINVDSKVTSDTVEKLKQVDGVISVNALYFK